MGWRLGCRAPLVFAPATISHRPATAATSGRDTMRMVAAFARPRPAAAVAASAAKKMLPPMRCRHSTRGNTAVPLGGLPQEVEDLFASALAAGHAWAAAVQEAERLEELKKTLVATLTVHFMTEPA